MATRNGVNLGLFGSSGTGAFAGTTSPTFTTPLLGTPTSGTLTNCAGLPIAGIATGTGSATHVTNSSGVSSFTAAMTNGQVLIGSTGATPTPATLTAGAGITVTNSAGGITLASPGSVLISSVDATGLTSLPFTGLSSTAALYRLVVTHLTTTVDGWLPYIRTSTNNGVSYDSGGSDYSWSYQRYLDSASASSAGSTGDGQIQLAQAIGNNLGETLTAEILLYVPWATADATFTWNARSVNQSTVGSTVNGAGARISIAAINAISLIPSSGTFTQGHAYLYLMTL